MKILNREQIREWDNYTISNEPISSIKLMERASLVFCDWFENKIEYNRNQSIKIVCGPGNNGGDGLAIARLLNGRSYPIEVIICHISKEKSPDFQSNLERLPLRNGITLIDIHENDGLDFLNPENIVIDAIFGSGLSRPIEGFWAELIAYINSSTKEIYSVDIPSGLECDNIASGFVINSKSVLSFELPKLSFFLVENEKHIGSWDYRSIGLLTNKLSEFISPYFFLHKSVVKDLIPSRTRFQHKGHFGHAGLIGGSKGMIGAMILAAKTCLRSGVGLVTCHLPECGEEIIQLAAPEAMFGPSEGTIHLKGLEISSKFTCLGIGPGMGQSKESSGVLTKIFETYKKRLVIDADALNLIARDAMLSKIPEDAILTPHPKEFERLFGPSENSLERIKLQIRKSLQLGIFIVLKGAHSTISTPDGKCYFNSTGNPGMATGGSGDVLTGLLTGLIAQSMDIKDAILLGVYLHGLAADFASIELTENTMIAGDIIDYLPKAFKSLN